MTPKERFNAASQKHRDALQALLDKHKGAGPSGQVTALTNQLAQEKATSDQLRTDYDGLLDSVSDYLEKATQQIVAVDGAAAADPAAQAPAAAIPSAGA